MIEEKIVQDLKKAMLNRDAFLVSALRSIKSAFLYFKILTGKRDQSLSDSDAISIMSKEAKKRQESADLYIKGGDQERAGKELKEKEIIESYLPAKLDPEKLKEIVSQVINDFGKDKTKMGAIIADIKNKTNGRAEGSEIARLVKEGLD